MSTKITHENSTKDVIAAAAASNVKQLERGAAISRSILTSVTVEILLSFFTYVSAVRDQVTSLRR
jgi:hypothetical protein